MNSIIIKPGKEKSILRRHPWIFSGAVLRTEPMAPGPGPGEIVQIRDHKGSFLAKGYYNPASKICARILEFREDVAIDSAWWESSIKSSIGRRSYLAADSDAMRLVYAEADFLPGLIVDRYGKTIVIQALTAGIDKVKNMIAEIIDSILKPGAIYEKSDPDIRALEGLPPLSGPLSGGSVPASGDIVITENGIRYIVDPVHGQKTGFYLDQRDNRMILSSYASGREVLDCFCYTGGFTLAALKGGAASAVSVDTSEEALEALKKNLLNNNIPAGRCQALREDAFTLLRKYRDEGRLFDMIVLDPPKFAPSRKHRDKAMRAYKDINLLAMKALRPGGLLATFSCSGGISSADFKMALGWASIDAGREVQAVRTLTQAPDHPVRLSYPESEYLKGHICLVI